MKPYDGLSTKNTCYSTAYFIYGFCILRANLGWILFTEVLLSGCTTMYYILGAERCIKREFIPYVTSYYLHWAQLRLRHHCMYLHIICTVLNCFFGLAVCIFVTVLNCFFGLSAYPTEKRAVIYSHLSATYSYHSWNLMTFILKKTRYFRHCRLCVLRAQMDKAVNMAAGSVHNCATQFSFQLGTIL